MVELLPQTFSFSDAPENLIIELIELKLYFKRDSMYSKCCSSGSQGYKKPYTDSDQLIKFFVVHKF